MKVLVTGGAGYVGSTLVPELLAAGHSVRVLDSLLHGGQPLLPVWTNPRFEFVRGDVRDERLVSGLHPATRRPIRTRFRYAFPTRLSLPLNVSR